MTKNTPVRELKGVGTKRAELYSKIGINTVGELIFHFPRRYTDYSEPVPAASAQIGEHAVIKALRKSAGSSAAFYLHFGKRSDRARCRRLPAPPDTGSA